MHFDWSAIDTITHAHLGHTFPAAQIAISLQGHAVFERPYGFLDPETRLRAIDLDTRFDLASVTKLFTVTLFMLLVGENRVSIDQPVRDVIPEFRGARPLSPYPDPLNNGKVIRALPDLQGFADASEVTFRHLLAHNSGLPAWLPLWQLSSQREMRHAVVHCDFAYPIGARTIYSDIGLILLGFAVERILQVSLAEGVRARIATLLEMDSINFGPLTCDNVAPTEFSPVENKRLCGVVHDENARGLGGIAGHAGLFGNARDLVKLGAMYMRGGSPLLNFGIVREMTRLQAQDGDTRRGLGFALWSPDPEASGNPFSEGAFGHTGFTGTSLWVDPNRSLVVSLMTNRVFYGRDGARDMMRYRVECHRAIVRAVDRIT
jgi:CubicO group peptidase (beta-lactamase class C family)